MIFFINNNGTIVKDFPSPVYQGSDNANNIYVVAPFARNLTATIAFGLPNGVFTQPYNLTCTGEISGFTDDNGNKYFGWSMEFPNDITSVYGAVVAQIRFYVGKKVLATSATTFTVGRGVPALLPETPTEDVYEQILSLISTLQQDLGNGYYAARAVYAWNSVYTYGANELVYYPKDSYGVFVKSVYSNNSYPPYNEANELDEHWTVVFDFNLLHGAVDRSESAAQAAKSSAISAGQFAFNAELSAKEAKKSEDAAAKYAEQIKPAMVNQETLILQ